MTFRALALRSLTHYWRTNLAVVAGVAIAVAVLAGALVREPALLLCDEPTGNLDRHTAASVSSLLLELHQRSRTILVIVTHNPELGAMCSRRLELADGALKDTGQ